MSLSIYRNSHKLIRKNKQKKRKKFKWQMYSWNVFSPKTKKYKLYWSITFISWYYWISRIDIPNVSRIWRNEHAHILLEYGKTKNIKEMNNLERSSLQFLTSHFKKYASCGKKADYVIHRLWSQFWERKKPFFKYKKILEVSVLKC